MDLANFTSTANNVSRTNIAQLSSSNAMVSTSGSAGHPFEIFVGNLSYFCEERHLYELFSKYSNVTHVRVMRSEDKTRSLLFGFVAFASRQEMIEMCTLFKGQLYFGRRLRVQPSYFRNVFPDSGRGHQIHVSISSTFAIDQIVRPVEPLLLKYFLRFGSISDVQVNCYTIHTSINKQEGYAFVTFEDMRSVELAVSNPLHVVDDIHLVCAISNRRPRRTMASSNNVGTMSTGGPNRNIGNDGTSFRNIGNDGTSHRNSQLHLQPLAFDNLQQSNVEVELDNPIFTQRNNNLATYYTPPF